MEALVRWEHPEQGLVSPARFIPVAEDSGLILPLGRHVLEEACRQLAAWQADGTAGPDLAVAVNVSARQLGDPAFPGVVSEILEHTGLAPRCLGLEVTETLLMESGTTALTVMRDLEALGVGLLLDDFGTGVSSLARLKRLPVGTLKIDRSFVSGLGEEHGEDDAIVGAVVAMADRLGLRTVAEGVETAEQLEALRALGCDRIQGFLFSRPLDADAMAAYLRAQ
jgi:Amt family ammonium transporter